MSNSLDEHTYSYPGKENNLSDSDLMINSIAICSQTLAPSTTATRW